MSTLCTDTAHSHKSLVNSQAERATGQTPGTAALGITSGRQCYVTFKTHANLMFIPLEIRLFQSLVVCQSQIDLFYDA